MQFRLVGLVVAGVLAVPAFATTIVNIPDPTGDPVPGAMGTFLDLINVKVSITPTALEFVLSLPAGASASSMSGVVELETDDSLLSGRESAAHDYGLIGPTGVDYRLEFPAVGSAGFVTAIHSGGEDMWDIAITRAGPTVTLAVPRASAPGEFEAVHLGGPTLGVFAMVGNVFGPTDIAPNSGDFHMFSIPEPATLALLGIAGTFLLRRRGSIAG